jgi:hypothetical protein
MRAIPLTFMVARERLAEKSTSVRAACAAGSRRHWTMAQAQNIMAVAGAGS